MVLREDVSTGSRAALGAIAGFVATAVMTAAMQRLHEQLPAEQRYPLTPREITAATMSAATDDATATRTLVAHFLYGALAGALYGGLARRGGASSGVVCGIGVCCVSYLGWIPAFGILKPATQHPAARNELMLTGHVIWGALTAWTLRELIRAHRGGFAGGPARDRVRVGSSQAAHAMDQRAPRHRHRIASRDTGNPSTARTN